MGGQVSGFWHRDTPDQAQTCGARNGSEGSPGWWAGWIPRIGFGGPERKGIDRSRCAMREAAGGYGLDAQFAFRVTSNTLGSQVA